MREMKIFLEAKDLVEADRDDLLWLDDHPDCLCRRRYLRDDESLLVDTTIFVGVAVDKFGDGVSKTFFDANHLHADLMIRLWRVLGLAHRPPFTKKGALT